MEQKDTRTIYDLIRNVLDARTHNNLTGVLYAFQKDSSRLRTILEANAISDGTEFDIRQFNRHPICVLWSDFITILTGSETGMRFTRSYIWCENMQAQSGMCYPELPLPVDAN